MRLGPGLVVLLSLLGCSAPADESASAAFVSLPAADAIEKIALADGSILSHTVVGMLPHNLVLGPDGDKLYVALVGSQAVAEIDVESGRLNRTFLTEPVPEQDAEGLPIEAHVEQDAFSHTTCFACHNTIIGSQPFGLALSEDGRKLFATHIRSGNLSVIDTANGRIDEIVHLTPTGQAHEATGISRLGGDLFVSLLPTLPTLEPHPPAVIRRLDGESLATLSESPTGRNSPILLADPTREEVFVSNAETNTVSRFDAQGDPAGTLTAGNSPYGLELLPDGQRLIVADFYDGTVSVVDLDSGQRDVVPLTLNGQTFSNPTHLALSPDGGTAYVVSGTPKESHLLELNLTTLAVDRALPLGGLGFDVVLAPSGLPHTQASARLAKEIR